MSSADWTLLANSISSSSVARGVTAGFTPPSGGGTFVYGMRSKVAVTGAVGLYVNLANFSPTAQGADISAAIRKEGGAGNTDHEAFVFAGLQGTDVSDLGYLLGLSDDDPAHLILRKGSLVGGLPDDPVGSSGILAKSTNTYAVDTWVHVRLEMVVNASGDVVLNVYENDLSSNTVASPTWVKVPGMSDWPGSTEEETAFIDDALGNNSGSSPYTSGRVGFAGHFADISRVVLFDHIAVAREL